MPFTAAELRDMLAKAEVEEKNLAVSEPFGAEAEPAAAAQESKNFDVYLGNLPRENIPDDEIRAWFKERGVTVPVLRRFTRNTRKKCVHAFLVFSDEESCEKAVGLNQHEWDGSALSIERPHEKGMKQKRNQELFPETKKPCYGFAKASCTYGDKCKFSHDTLTADQVESFRKMDEAKGAGGGGKDGKKRKKGKKKGGNGDAGVAAPTAAATDGATGGEPKAEKNKKMKGGSTTQNQERAAPTNESDETDKDKVVVELRFALTSVYVAGVIGKGGATIKRISEESKATLKFQKGHDSLPESRSLGPDLKHLSIRGTLPQIEKACALIGEEMLRVQRVQEGEVSLTTLVPNSKIAMVIGQKGKRIRELEQSTGVVFKVQEDHVYDQRYVTLISTPSKVAAGVRTMAKVLPIDTWDVARPSLAIATPYWDRGTKIGSGYDPRDQGWYDEYDYEYAPHPRGPPRGPPLNGKRPRPGGYGDFYNDYDYAPPSRRISYDAPRASGPPLDVFTLPNYLNSPQSRYRRG